MRDAKNDVVKHAEEFTKGQIVAQALGFRTEGLAATQEANFKYNARVQKLIQEKGTLRTRLDRELELGSPDNIEDAFDAILDFNAKNPNTKLTVEDLPKQLLERARQRALSDRGIRVEKNMYPYLAELLDLSREKIEREAAKPEKAEK